MAKRAGSADLPLHSGRVPKWLADRMTRLGGVISEAVVHHYGRDELLRRLAHPFWFQSFGAVMGMDWHSSGITTSVLGALKRGLTPLSNELGIHVCGGRGKHSRQTPHELVAIGERVGFDGAVLADASRLVAKVDSAAIQDGFDLYLHGFIVTDDGKWAVDPAGDERHVPAGAPLSLAVGGSRRASSTSRTRPSTGKDRARSSISPTAGQRPRARRRSRSWDHWGLTALPANSWRSKNAKRTRRRLPARSRCCRIWSCRSITMFARRTWCCAGCMGPLRRRPIAGQRISPTCS